MKGGMLLLLLGIPFALYAAWQVNGATHIGAGAPDAPADKTATKEQLAAASAKAAAWSGETQKAVKVSWQYSAADAADDSKDATVAGVVKAASARAANLNDLDRFLSDVEKPKFTGDARMQTRYAEWTAEQASLRTAAKAVDDWFAQPLKINSAEDADKAMAAVVKLIDTYGSQSRFADNRKATVWRFKARLAVIDALTALADAQYRAAASEKLPLKPGANAATAAVATLGGLKTQLAALAANLKVDDDKLPPDDPLRTAIEAKSGGADEYSAREELLALFAKPDLFTNASGAAAWLKSVASQYAKTKDKKVQALIRDKVQQFCEAFVAPVVRLDDDVLIRGKPVPRTAVKVTYEPKLGDKAVAKELSADATEFNEFEAVRKPPGVNQLVKNAGSEFELKDLKPTELSKTALVYNAARAALTDRTTAPRWTAESVAELKKACEAQKDLVDQLKQPDGTSPKIATRVAGLVAGMAACKELFEVVP